MRHALGSDWVEIKDPAGNAGLAHYSLPRHQRHGIKHPVVDMGIVDRRLPSREDGHDNVTQVVSQAWASTRPSSRTAYERLIFG